MRFEKTKNPKTVFAVAVGPGREETFKRFCDFANRYAPDVKIEAFMDNKGLGCGVARARLFNTYKRKYEIYIQIDDDMELSEGWIEKVWKAYEEYPMYNLFTTRINEGLGIRTAGVGMWEIGDAIRMVHRGPRADIDFVHFAPGGCMIICRKGLGLHMSEIPICEEYMLYGEWLKNNLGGAVSINTAVLNHNIKDNPRVSNFRTFENIKTSAEAIKRKYGFSFVEELRDVATHLSDLSDEETRKIESWIKDLKKI